MAKRKPLRPRIHPYLPPELMARFDEYAAARGATDSAVVAEALEQLMGGAGERDVLYRRLDNINRSVEVSAVNVTDELRELRQQVLAQGQLVRLLLATWLTSMEPRPAERRPKPAALYRELMETLGKHVLAGRSLIDELPREAREALAARALERDAEREGD